ncbi:unnamed protein product [Prunus brigantina]
MRAIIPPSPQQVCAICSNPTHPMELCPSTTQGSEQFLQVNSFQRPRNDPYSNTYNPGWRNHPNFSWSNQRQQVKSSHPFQQQMQPSNEPKKPALEDLIAQFVQTSQQNQNTMQASINKLETQRLGIGELKSASVSLQLADRSVTYPKGIIEDVLIKVKQFVLPADFLVLDMEEDRDIPLLLGHPFLATAGTLIDVQQGTLTLRVQVESVEFKVFEAVKKPRDLEECSRIDLLDPIVHVNYLENTSTNVLKAKSSPPPYVKCMRSSLGRARIYQCCIKSFSKMSRLLWHLLAKDHTKTLHDKAIVRKEFGQQPKHCMEEVAIFATSAPP